MRGPQSAMISMDSVWHCQLHWAYDNWFRTIDNLWWSSCLYGGVLDRTAGNIEHYMDLLSARQKLVASNIANVDTPGYKTKDIDFQFEFMSLTKGVSPNAVEAPGLVVKNDGNNVSMDREARLLAENALRFNLATNLMKAQLKMVASAIQGGAGNSG